MFLRRYDGNQQSNQTNQHRRPGKGNRRLPHQILLGKWNRVSTITNSRITVTKLGHATDDVQDQDEVTLNPKDSMLTNVRFTRSTGNKQANKVEGNQHLKGIAHRLLTTHKKKGPSEKLTITKIDLPKIGSNPIRFT